MARVIGRGHAWSENNREVATYKDWAGLLKDGACLVARGAGMWPEECKGAAEGAWCLGGRVWLTMVSNECVRRGRCCFQSAKGGEDVDEGGFRVCARE